MKSRLLRYLAVILVNVGILASIEFGSALLIRKHFKKANDLFMRPAVVEHPFALPAGYEMKANAIVGGPKGTTRIRTDDKGHAIVPDALPSPRFTLAVLGGSAMFGTGVTDNAATVPSQVQTVLRREYGVDVNVVNLAARGYVSLQELLVLNQSLAEQPFDMVVSVSGYNDLMRHLKGDLNPSYVKRPDCDAVLLVRRVEAGNLVISNLVPALRRVSRTANLFALTMERREARARQGEKTAMAGRQMPKTERLKEEAAREPTREDRETTQRQPSSSASTFLDAHLAHYAMMNAVCEVHHTYFKLFFQPSAFTKANLSKHEKGHLVQKDCFGSEEKFDALTMAHNSYRAAFDALPMPFHFTDLADAFGQTNTQVYLDGCHYNEEGAILLARVIAADLAPIIQARLAAQKSQP